MIMPSHVSTAALECNVSWQITTLVGLAGPLANCAVLVYVVAVKLTSAPSGTLEVTMQNID